jgi:hypothetical protein
VVQVAPFRQLRRESSKTGSKKLANYLKYDMRQMHVAFTGTVPLTPDDEEELVRSPPCDMGEYIITATRVL